MRPKYLEIPYLDISLAIQDWVLQFYSENFRELASHGSHVFDIEAWTRYEFGVQWKIYLVAYRIRYVCAFMKNVLNESDI